MVPDMLPRTTDESKMLDLASQRLPGGVLGSARFREDLAFVVKRAKGAHLWDWSGREYIDYLLGSGPMFLGHAHPAVVRAVTDQLQDGSTRSEEHTSELQSLAYLVCRLLLEKKKKKARKRHDENETQCN